MVFFIDVEPSTGQAEYVYDVEERLVVSRSQHSDVRLRWTLRTPDPENHGATGSEFSMNISSGAEFALVDGRAG